MKKKTLKKLSLLMALCMSFSAVSVTAYAEDAENPVVEGDADSEDTTYVLAGSDFQNPDGPEASATMVKTIIDAIQAETNDVAMDGFLFAGDYDFNTHGDEAETRLGITTLKTTVQSEYPTLTDEDMVFVEGNHDYYAADLLSASGAHDTEDYGVYVIHEDEYMNWQEDHEATIKIVTTRLKQYLNNKVAEGYDKPVFVISHLPLHFTHRTNGQGDALYAKYLIDAMNSAGGQGLNIIYLYGHDHAFGYDNYLGGQAVYLPKGSQMAVAVSREYCEYETLGFTYMNAGFTGYYSNETLSTFSECDPDLLTLTVFEITGSDVTVRRYNQDGLYDLKKAGSYYTSYDNPLWGYAEDKTVYESPQVINLTAPWMGVTTSDEATGVTLTTATQVSLTVEPIADVAGLNNDSKVTDYTAYKISAEGLAAGNQAYITIPVDDTYDADQTSVYRVTEKGVLEDVDALINGENGEKTATFATNKLGTYVVVHKVLFTGYEKINSLTELVSGEKYLLVFDECDNGGTGNLQFGNFVMAPEVVWSKDGTRQGYRILDTGAVLGHDSLSPVDKITEEYRAYEWTMTKGENGWIVSSDDGAVTLTNTTDYKITATLTDDPTELEISKGKNGFEFKAVGEEMYLDMNARGLINGSNVNVSNGFYLYKWADTPKGGLNDWTGVDTSGVYNYVLDTDGVDFGPDNRYLLVASDTNAVMDAEADGVVYVTISNNAISLNTEAYDWYLDQGKANAGDMINDGKALIHSFGKMYWVDRSNGLNWVITERGTAYPGYYKFSNTDVNGTWQLRYDQNGYMGTTASVDRYVRLYKYTPVIDAYAKIVGDTEYQVPYGTSGEAAIAEVKEGIEGYLAADADGTNESSLDDSAFVWKWIDSYTGKKAGCYTMEISFNGFVLGTVEVQVEKPVVGKVDMVASYDMSAENGKLIDITGNGNDAALIGFTDADFTVQEKENYTDTILNFDGTNKYVELPAGLIDTEVFTVEATFATDVTGNAMLWCLGTGDEVNYVCLSPRFWPDAGDLRGCIKDSTTEYIFEDGLAGKLDSSETTVTVEFDHGDMALLVNGELISTMSTDFSIQDILAGGTRSDISGYIGKSLYAADPMFMGTLTQFDVYAEITEAEPPIVFPYTDVAADAWYYDVVCYNYVNGYMTGKSADIFAPDATLTRAELTSILYRVNDEPEMAYEAVFTDVQADTWYASPVLWAYENKVVNGYAEGDFKPDDAITREQLAVIMHNYATAQGYAANQSATLDAFDDAAQVSGWAAPAVQWAVATGVISGKNGVSLDPQGNATRAEAAAIIQRFMENIAE